MSVEQSNLSFIEYDQSKLSPRKEKEIFLNLSAPIAVQWEVTPWCNERCVHCYNFWRQEPLPAVRPSPIALETFHKAAAEIAGNGVFHVTVTGGEPLAVLRWILPDLEYLSEQGVHLSLNSNLTLLTSDKAKVLNRLGVRTVLTSLMSADAALNDSLANSKGALEKVVRGIRIAREEGLWVAVNMVVTKKNLHDIFSTAKLVKELGVDAFSATKASRPIGSSDFSGYALSKQELNLMLGGLLRIKNELGLNVDSLEFYPHCSFESPETREIFGNRICNAGKTACTIGHDGMIRPCSHASMTYGSVTEGLANCWEKLYPWRTDVFIPVKCGECAMREVCAGGCRTEAYADCGKLTGEDPYCDFSRQVAPVVRNPDVVLGEETDFLFSSVLKLRPESFGGILYKTPIKWLAVTQELYRFVIKNRDKLFTIRDLAESLGVPVEGARETATLLVSRSIIEKKGGE